MQHETVRILVLDDDEDDTFLVREIIDEIPGGNYQIEVAHTQDDGAVILREQDIDIVLCDYLMGAQTGIQFINAMRDEGHEVPVILLTGMGDKATDQAALEAGASDYLSKIDLSSSILDRAIRYAIASANRQKLFQAVLNNVNAGLVLFDSNAKPALWNPEFEEMASYCAEVSGSRQIVEFARAMHKSDRIIKIKSKVFEKKISDTPGDGQVMLLQDVTEHFEALEERKIAESKAAHLAMHCSLTGLPNRNAFSERISKEIASANENNHEFYLLNLDLNKFKEVNDLYGHNFGDRLLCEVANRLRKCCRSEDYIARLGGDEFVAIQRKQDPNETIPSLAQRFANAVGGGIGLGSVRIQSGISVGVATYPHHGRKSAELMSNADIAMYRAKADPTSNIHAFDEELDRTVRENRFLSQELRSAVNDGDLDLCFQPQADLNNGEITGFEALARWNHPTMGPVSPSVFIPLAEESGTISKLGEIILEKSCRIAARWDSAINIAVNISPAQIRDLDLVQKVQSILLKTGLRPDRLELEVTESVLIEDSLRALHVLRGIKNLGVSIAMDDFGTGYSSLSTLISFPFDKIKIDRSFIEECSHNHQAAVVTRTIINLTQQLGCRVIAEGVQTNEQVQFLLAEGCYEMQGYLIGKPARPEKAKEMYLSEDYTHFSAKCA